MNPQTRFARVLKSREVIALAFGAMIGWSWVLISGYWLEQAGTLGTAVAFLLGGFAICLVGLTYSELAAAMPRAGGEHVYTHRALGLRWSFVCTWALLFAYIAVCLFESVALPTGIEFLLPQIRLGTLWNVLGADVDLGFVLVGVAGALAMTVVNYLGIRTAALVQTLVTGLILLAGLVLISGAALHGQAVNTEPMIAAPATGILVVLIMVPTFLIGFDVIPQSAEEIDLPPNRIGRLLIISVACAVCWYVLVSLAVGLGLPVADRSSSTMATADAATALWGAEWAGTLLVLGGIGGILTSWNAFMIGASRVIFALAESGLIPAVFGRIHPRHKTPYVAVLSLGAVSALAPLFGRTVLIWLINISSFAVLVAFVFVAIAFLVLRRKEPDMPRPFRVSHPRLVGYGAISLCLALLFFFFPWSASALAWPEEWLAILAWTLLGAWLLWRAPAHKDAYKGR